MVEFPQRREKKNCCRVVFLINEKLVCQAHLLNNWPQMKKKRPWNLRKKDRTTDVNFKIFNPEKICKLIRATQIWFNTLISFGLRSFVHFEICGIKCKLTWNYSNTECTVYFNQLVSSDAFLLCLLPFPSQLWHLKMRIVTKCRAHVDFILPSDRSLSFHFFAKKDTSYMTSVR